ncbi:MAG: hydrogenase maturation nickel metallochaperone HypA [Termitinemataceae bacterium]
MHELGIIMNVVETVEDIARQNGLSTVQTLVLQVGELSPVIPHYIQECYPAAVDGTLLQETELKIEIIPAEGICKECSEHFTILPNKGRCPHCGSNQWHLLRGKEFLIKEILAC